MKEARFRIPVEEDYLLAIGRAVYSFAYLEWQVVWCCEKIRPGSLHRITKEEMTAGKIARVFTNVARNMRPSPLRDELANFAARFSELVKTRNQIVHGKPCTGPNGQARLSADSIWEIPALEDAADQFAQCSIELNDLYYSQIVGKAEEG